MSTTEDGFAASGGVWVRLIRVIAVVWLLIPLAVAGIERLLRDRIRAQKATQALLTALSQQADPITFVLQEAS